MPNTILTYQTGGPGLIEITRDVTRWIGPFETDGLATVFVRHTSCSLPIQENADLDVQRDLQAYFERLVPHANAPSMAYLVHRAEGPDDMPAHIKSALLPVSLSIPVVNGHMVLGTWQGIYLVEHRTHPHQRQVVVQFLPDSRD